MRCRKHELDLETVEDIQLHILEHLITMEEAMTESNSQQAALDADVAKIGANVQTIVDELKQQIADNPSKPAAELDLSGLDALAESTGTEAAADAPVVTAPVSTPPMVTDPPLQAVPTGKPLYIHASANAFDPTIWPAAGVNSGDGQQLYTFANDLPGGEPTGASDDWQVYGGATQTVGSQAPTGVAVSPVLPDNGAAIDTSATPPTSAPSEVPTSTQSDPSGSSTDAPSV